MVRNTFFITENLVNTYIDLIIILNLRINKECHPKVTLLVISEMHYLVTTTRFTVEPFTVTMFTM